MLEALPHRLVSADALRHDGKLKVAGRHVVADPGMSRTESPGERNGKSSRRTYGHFLNADVSRLRELEGLDRFRTGREPCG